MADGARVNLRQASARLSLDQAGLRLSQALAFLLTWLSC